MMEEIEIELPITFRVKFEAFKSEPRTRHYPGDPAHIEINTIEMVGVDGIYLQSDTYGLFGTIISLHEDEILEACWDLVNENAAENAMMQAEYRRDARGNR